MMSEKQASHLDLGAPGGIMVKNLPANAGDTGDMGSIPGLGCSPRVGNGNSSILAWTIPWAEETAAGGYSPWGHSQI